MDFISVEEIAKAKTYDLRVKRGYLARFLRSYKGPYVNVSQPMNVYIFLSSALLVYGKRSLGECLTF